MRILGIDYGDARIGLALSDASATLCGRAWTLTEWNLERAVAAIADVVRTEGVERIVLARKRAAPLRTCSRRRRGWRSCSGTSGAAPSRRTASCTPTAARRKSTARRSTPSRRA